MVLYPGSCEHLEFIYPRDGGEANKNLLKEGFDNFRDRRVTVIIKGSWGCLGHMPNHLRLKCWSTSRLSQQASQTGQTEGWARLTTHPTHLALLLCPASAASPVGTAGSDNDGDASLRAGAVELWTHPRGLTICFRPPPHTYVTTSTAQDGLCMPLSMGFEQYLRLLSSHRSPYLNRKRLIFTRISLTGKGPR